MRRTGVVLAAAVAALAASAAASASSIVARNTSDAVLAVDGARALVSYRSGGLERHAVLWGAIDARPPNPRIPQVAFHVRYGAGAARGGSCLPYTGPSLPFLVAACTARDGSYWALQSWQRLLKDYGGTQGAWELHLSHWRGPLPELEVWQDWVYKRYPHLFGRFTYRGHGVYGFHSTRAGTRSTRTAAISTSTRSTRSTAPAGIARTASSRTGPGGRSATGSSATAAIRAAEAAPTGSRWKARASPRSSPGTRAHPARTTGPRTSG